MLMHSAENLVRLATECQVRNENQLRPNSFGFIYPICCALWWARHSAVILAVDLWKAFLLRERVQKCNLHPCHHTIAQNPCSCSGAHPPLLHVAAHQACACHEHLWPSFCLGIQDSPFQP